MSNALALLRLLPVSERDKDAEILALRHQIMVLERQLHGDWVRLPRADRGVGWPPLAFPSGEEHFVVGLSYVVSAGALWSARGAMEIARSRAFRHWVAVVLLLVGATGCTGGDDTEQVGAVPGAGSGTSRSVTATAGEPAPATTESVESPATTRTAAPETIPRPAEPAAHDDSLWVVLVCLIALFAALATYCFWAAGRSGRELERIRSHGAVMQSHAGVERGQYASMVRELAQQLHELQAKNAELESRLGDFKTTQDQHDDNITDLASEVLDLVGKVEGRDGSQEPSPEDA